MFNTKEISYDLRNKYIMYLSMFNKVTYRKIHSNIMEVVISGIHQC